MPRSNTTPYRVNALIPVLLLGTLVGGLLFTGCKSTQNAPLNSEPAAPPTGNQLFEEYCSMCHRPGRGEMGMDRLAPKTDKLATPETLAAFLQNPPPGMPQFPPEQFSPAWVEALQHYLVNTYRTPTIPPAPEAPKQGADTP